MGFLSKHSEVDISGIIKGDLGVDCISRNSAIKALDYDIKCFEFKSGVSKHMDDIAKLLNTIYETQVNNIKSLPSVTPQEPIKALGEELRKVREGIKDEKVLIGFNMAVAICNKHLGGSEVKDGNDDR